MIWALIAAGAAATGLLAYVLRRRLSAGSPQAQARAAAKAQRRREKEEERERQRQAEAEERRRRQEEDRHRREEEEDRRRRQEEEEKRRQKEEEERRLGRKADKIQEAARANPDTAQRMAARAGLGHESLKDVSWSRTAALEAARQVPDDIVQACWLAATQQDIEFDLKAEVKREAALWPTADIEPQTMTDLAQIVQMAPEQSVLLEDDQFYQQLAEMSLPVLQPFEKSIRRKRLYILLDVSGSMNDPMVDGYPRHVWARGVCVSLIYQALAGQADYLLRFFDDGPHELLAADNPLAASQTIDLILDRGFSGGGTSIFSAFQRAVNDIRSRGGVGCSEILIISDGQDNSMDDSATVKRWLGEDIKLHAAMIGCDSPALKAVAKTYRTFI